MPATPVRLVLLDDFEVVVAGLATVLEPYRDRVEVVELDVDTTSTRDCDIVLYDTFGAEQGEAIRCEDILRDCRGTKLVVYTWNLDEAVSRQSIASGVSGVLSKELTAEELVEALERIHHDETVVSPEPAGGSVQEPARGDWPGRSEGLSEREAEILVYIVQGLSNDDVAAKAFLSINTVKSYIRSAYRKMGVSTRSQAVLWGVDHGFRIVPRRIRPEDAL